MPSREDLLARMAALTTKSNGKDLQAVRREYKLHLHEVERQAREPHAASVYAHALHQEPAFRHYRVLMDAHRKTPVARAAFNARVRQRYAKDPYAKREQVRRAYYESKGIPEDKIPPRRGYRRRSST